MGAAILLIADRGFDADFLVRTARPWRELLDFFGKLCGLDKKTIAARRDELIERVGDPTAALVESGCVAVAYETVTGRGGALPLLAPMSEVAGRMAIQEGAKYLERPMGGLGILLGIFAARRAVRPVGSAAQAASAIAGGSERTTARPMPVPLVVLVRSPSTR